MKHLDILDGTDYEVSVVRDDMGLYDVTVTKPANVADEYFNGPEVIGVRTLTNTATYDQLAYCVKAIIDTDRSSLVGTYTGNRNKGEDVTDA